MGHSGKTPRHARFVEPPKHRVRKALVAFLCIAVALVLIACAGVGVLVNAGRNALHDAGFADAEIAKTIRHNGNNYVLNPNVSTILFLGIDKDNGRATAPYNGQADAVMALVLDEAAGKVTCLAISRSSIVPVITRDFETGQLGEAENYLCLGYSFGYDDADSASLMCKDVSQLLNRVPVESYYSLNMSGVGALADAVGGVQLTAISDVAKTDIKQGDALNLTGDLARDYVWQRDTADDYSSAERLERQEQFAKAFAAKALAMCKQNPLALFDLFRVAEEHSITNVGVSELAYLAYFLATHDDLEFSVVALPGDVVPDPPNPTKYIVDDVATLQMVLDVFYVEQ